MKKTILSCVVVLGVVCASLAFTQGPKKTNVPTTSCTPPCFLARLGMEAVIPLNKNISTNPARDVRIVKIGGIYYVQITPNSGTKTSVKYAVEKFPPDQGNDLKEKSKIK